MQLTLVLFKSDICNGEAAATKTADPREPMTFRARHFVTIYSFRNVSPTREPRGARLHSKPTRSNRNRSPSSELRFASSTIVITSIASCGVTGNGVPSRIDAASVS
jgi:hypothetical protein